MGRRSTSGAGRWRGGARTRVLVGGLLAASLMLSVGCSKGSTGEAGQGRLSRTIRMNKDVARSEPCAHIGSLHRDSRSNLENLKACGEISYDEWACMARALAEIDRRFTATCEQTPIDYDTFQRAQRDEYAACLADGGRDETVEKAVDLDVFVVACESVQDG